MHADRLGEIAIAVRVIDHFLAEPGQHLERIKVVGGRKRLPDLGELQHQQPAARPQHAPHLAEGLLLVGHVAQAEGDGDDVEVSVGERQLLGIALGDGTEPAFVEQAIAAARQHRIVDVGEPDFTGGTDALAEGGSEVARAAGDVEDAFAGSRTCDLQGEHLPQPVQAGGHQVVHQVVLVGDRGKHALDPARLFAFGYAFEAEVGVRHDGSSVLAAAASGFGRQGR